MVLASAILCAAALLLMVIGYPRGKCAAASGCALFADRHSPFWLFAVRHSLFAILHPVG
ncbi:MAG: hypothetical protein AB7G76_02680 [Steroidobacteraceae bacterium]